MRKQEMSGNIAEKRLLNIDELSAYTGLGKTSVRQWAEKAGAAKHFGRRVLFDKSIIDRALDNAADQEA